MTYSLLFRKKVLAVREKEGLSIAQVAKRFDVGIASVTRWLKRVEPIKHYKRPWLKIDMYALAQDIRDYPDAYLRERAERFGVSINAIFHALRRLNVTVKKNTVPSQNGRYQTIHLPGEG